MPTEMLFFLTTIFVTVIRAQPTTTTLGTSTVATTSSMPSSSAPTPGTVTLSCLDAQGNKADFWVGLKHSRKINISYYNPASGKFDADEQLLSSGDHVSNTILQIYNNTASLSYMMWNDEEPVTDKQLDQAHAKGLLAFDGVSGFLLVHSAPEFPVSLSLWKSMGYTYPGPQIYYGQSFMCMTLAMSQFETVMQALNIDWVEVYDSNLLPQHTSFVPTMQAVINMQPMTTAVATSFNIVTAGGKAFTIFAKNRQWNNELYESLIAPTFKDDLFVETWINGVGTIASVCKPYKVLELTEVSMPDGVSWKTSDDHSKWCIGQTTTWVCVGDINRQHGQFDRGGGQYCTNDATLWGAFKSIIAGVQACM